MGGGGGMEELNMENRTIQHAEEILICWAGA